ncbi:DUF4190 domain-containing protein [Micromonospora sp. KC721]|uniref:DUF4190 domain-containing protein n=1 Tax=Micromonospora sp. KC721 TaxID=2530380 RepID=UPI0010455268|nr:DUF4190 domain-containing protein [Micromonospora sp. KC721]TDB78242.1 DUF4190 domain-containing protein [Micromonospora sp. KC721]
MTGDDRPGRPVPPAVPEATDGGWEPWAGHRTRTNRTAVAAFVLGLLGGVFGLVLGLVALVQIRRSGQRGRGFAVAGLVLCAAWAFAAMLVVTGLPFRSGPQESGVQALRTGDCFRVGDAPAGTRTAPDRITTVACTEPHDGELIDHLPGYARYPGEAYPGSAALSARAESECRRQQRSYVLDPLSLPADVRLRWYVPSRVEWESAPRITCYLAAGGQPLTRPLRQDATVLRPEQYTYLMAVREFNEARAVLAAEGPTAAPAELRAMVERAGSANASMWLTLSGAAWPAQAREPVEKLIAESQGAAMAWLRAEQAPDREQMLRLAAQAEQRRDPQTDLAVRQALGLSTAQGDPAR